MRAPITSAFGAHTPASQVVAGPDLTAVTVIITGGAIGIGLEITGAPA